MTVRSLQKLVRLLTIFVVTTLCTTMSLAEEEPTLVMLFGDSITYGFASRGQGNGNTNVGAPDIDLSNLLNSDDRPATVINYGSGGTPTGPAGDPGLVAFDHGLERIDSNLLSAISRYPNHQDRRFNVIMYGFNDRAWGIPNSTTGFNIQQIALSSLNRGFVPVIGSIAPCLCDNSSIPARNSAILSRVNSLIGSGKEVYYVDQYGLLINDIGQLLLSDGVHPNPTGYNRIAQNWFDQALKDLVPQNQKSITGAILLLLLDDDEE